MSEHRLIPACIALLLALQGLPACAAGAVEKKQSVDASDLGNGTTIIGFLGLPLGELASVRARAVGSNTLEVEQYLEIMEVNRKPLARPIQLPFSIWEFGNLAGKPLSESEILSLRVYETGGMVGVPEAAMRETVFVQTVGWGFRTSLVILYEED